MRYDGMIEIAQGLSAKATKWTTISLTWGSFVERLQNPTRTNETLSEFLSSSKADQLRIKDVGGFVGGRIKNGRRKPENVVYRQLVTLDLDFATDDFWDDFTLAFECSACIHGTHKNSTGSPRYRLCIPLSRAVTPDEYVAISRRIAGDLGIELFDSTTFEPSRLMFWPSVPRDQVYYIKTQDGPWLDADEVLASYNDWTDSSEWPTSRPQAKDKIDKHQEDPLDKRGLIGAFCRAYTIQDAIQKWLSDIYIPSALEDRYTYTKGSTSAGLVIYDDKFAYSHHGTDPTSGLLCNAYDLVRIHKFGYLDKDGDPEHKLSTKAMNQLVNEDGPVREILAKDKIGAAVYDFGEQPGPEPGGEQDSTWVRKLEIDGRGNYLSSDANLNLIFTNDPRLKSLFRYNELDCKAYVFGSMPWRLIDKPEPMRNVDYSGVRNYLGSIYGITNNQKVDDALTLEMERNRYHPVRDYLEHLTWDGKGRLDWLLIDYLGAKENKYVRQVTAKVLMGAIARVMNPGCKFDLVLMLVGPQGAGKSTLVKRLGGKWFSDTFLTVQGKEALEQIQGSWIIEIAELSGLRKAEVESIKHFISKQEDTFRPAYARTVEVFPRQCIFIGTTNNPEFLKDPTGNRRFLPVDVDPARAIKDVFKIDQKEIDQIWAEAYVRWQKGETIYVQEDIADDAKAEQDLHREVDERQGIIEDFIERKLPANWDKMSLWDRKDYLDDPLSSEGTVRRQYICTAEIWCECLGKKKEDISRGGTKEVNDILRSLPGWRLGEGQHRFSIYGKQRFYERVDD